jgi:hypothetical protein
MVLGIKEYIIIGLSALLLVGGSLGAAGFSITQLNHVKEVSNLKKQRDEEQHRANDEKKRADGAEAGAKTLEKANKSLLDQNANLASADSKTDIRYIDRGKIIEKVVRERDLTTANWLIDSINTSFYDANAATPTIPQPAVAPR